MFILEGSLHFSFFLQLLTLNSKISEHDLNSKIAKTIKWIEKLHEVRVTISGDEGDKQRNERIISVVEESMKPVEGRILQKRVKDGLVKFTIMPTLKKEPKEASPQKKLLEKESPTPQIQQVRSHSTMSF